jgi:drug/metabolite transporter (DMT)-like permease
MDRQKPPAPGSNTLRALGWMLGALASFSMVAIAGRGTGRAMSTLDVLFLRSLLSFVIILAVVMAGPGIAEMRPQRFMLHLGRAISHFIAPYSWLLAIMMIPLAQVFALEFTAPIWITALAPLLLGERLTRIRILAAAIGFVGLIIVARPGVMAINMGVVLGLVAALGFALSMMATKSLTRDNSVLRILFYMFLLQFGLSSVALFDGISIPDWTTFGWVVVLTITGLTAHYSLARAFSLADSIIVAPMDFLRLPLIAVVGMLLYAEPFDPFVLTGGLVIIIGNLVNLWGERRGLARTG